MVAVVSGAGLGLSNSSKELAGSAGELGQAGLGRANERVTVNAATRNLVIQNRDEFVVGVGEDLNLLRTYNSLGGWDGDNNDSWRIGYYRRVTGLTPAGSYNTAGSTVTRTDADGFESVYTYTGGRYVSKDGSGAFDTMTYASGTWRWVDGATPTAETYTEGGAGSGGFRLDRVVNVGGHETRGTYSGTTGPIATLGAWKSGATSASATVTLTYDGNKRLTQIASSATGD